MTPKELENLVHQYNMDGELDETCIGSLYSTFICNYRIPTLVYYCSDDPFVYISRTLKICFYNGNIELTGDIPRDNPNYLTMTLAYPGYSINDDKRIEEAIQNLAKQYKQILADIKFIEMKKDFENGSNEN